MKTIFITISRGAIVANILRTDVLKFLLKQEDVRVVILSCNKIPDYFREEFNHPRIFLEHAPAKEFSKFRKFFIILFSGLVYSSIERWVLKYGFAPKPPNPKPVFYLKHITFSIISRITFFKYIARWIEQNIFIEKDFDYLFEKYKPDLLFCTSIYSNIDSILTKAAKRLNVPSICMPKSWDTIGRLFFRVIADKMILSSSSMKNWLSKEQLISKDDMLVSGLPQFDIYKQKTSFYTKEEFCLKTGLDPNKPIILLATEDGVVFLNEIYIKDLIEKNKILDKYNLVIRPHFRVILDKKYDIFKQYKNVYIDDQNIRIRYMFGDGWDASKENIEWLAEVIHASDIVIAFMSTFVLDAVAFDKPVINPYYDLDKNYNTVPIKEAYGFIHYKMVLNENGVALAKNGADVMNWIEKYLKNPEIHWEERSRIVENVCYKVDGKAGERIAKVALDYLEVSKQHRTDVHIE